ncbi:dnaJ [Symbiodinium microadriaticum]|nr:dnaJ [Symbiodinium microadriaticum]
MSKRLICRNVQFVPQLRKHFAAHSGLDRLTRHLYNQLRLIRAGVGLPSLVCRALGAAQAPDPFGNVLRITGHCPLKCAVKKIRDLTLVAIWELHEGLSDKLVVTITDAELRLVDALQEHHGHHPELRFEVLDWKLDAGEERYDLILASDILLACCEGPVFVPQLLARRLRRSPEARALLLNAHRGEAAQRTAMCEMRRQGFLVSSFAVSSSQELHAVSEERFSALPQGSQLLLVASWSGSGASEAQVETAADKLTALQ